MDNIMDEGWMDFMDNFMEEGWMDFMGEEEDSDTV
jgi:hypothetical protein